MDKNKTEANMGKQAKRKMGQRIKVGRLGWIIPTPGRATGKMFFRVQVANRTLVQGWYKTEQQARNVLPLLAGLNGIR